MTVQAAGRNLDITPQAEVVSHGSYVDWPAIAAGAVLAAAISFVLLTFGSAIGLTLVSPYEGRGASLPWLAIAFAVWLLWVQVSSFMAGGYVTGRLRRRANDATEHEVEVRDGFHGLLVWATGLLIAAVIAGVVAVAGAAGAAVSDNARSAVTVRSHGPDAVSMSTVMDILFRPETARPAAINQAARDEVGRILVRAATGATVSEADRAYAARVVALESGVSDAAARERVDAAIQEAKDDANHARKIGILVAFMTAAALAVSAAASVIAARRGGHHRDQGTVLQFLFRR